MNESELKAAQTQRKHRVKRINDDIDWGRALYNLHQHDKDALADALEGRSIDEIAAWIIRAYGVTERIRG